MMEVTMATRSKLSQSASRASATWPDVDTLGVIAMFCGAGLLLAMFLIISGFDLTDRFF
jgi:hypothetical protein